MRNVAQWAELRAGERRRFCERVGAAAGQPAAAVEEDLERGRFLGADEAVEYGILDEVGPARRRHPPPAGLRARAAAHGVPPAALRRGRADPARRETRPARVPTMRRWPRPDPAWHPSPPASGTSA